MSGNQRLVVFNLAIIFPIFVLTIMFPIFVLAAPRDGSSPDLVGLPDLPSFDVKGRAADISIFMDDIEEDENSRGTEDVIVEPIIPGLISQDPNAALRQTVVEPRQIMARDGSSPDLNPFNGMGRAADISIFMNNIEGDQQTIALIVDADSLPSISSRRYHGNSVKVDSQFLNQLLSQIYCK